MRSRPVTLKGAREGFTLVELLIVIAIIAILAAVAIPQYTKYVRKAAAANVQAALSSCLAEAMADFADTGDKTYDCKVDKGDGTSETVTITLDDDGNLSSISKSDFEVKGHSVSCTVHTDTNTITCSPS